jgi:hypothetical protein
MALAEKNIIDVIEILENNTIQIRNANIIERDGIEIAKTYHRHVVAPGEDIANQDAKVQAIANAIWTEEVINNYKASIKPIEPIVPVVTPEPIIPTDNNLE